MVKILEQKSALQILFTLLEKGGSSKTVALWHSIDGGITSFYTALNLLHELELVKSYRKYKKTKRILSLTEEGEMIAYRLAEIDEILLRKKRNYKKNDEI